MCKHVWTEFNDVRVCQRCGMTVNTLDGKIMFDRDFPNLNKKGRKKKK